MGKGLSLRARIYLILILLVVITLTGASIMVWYTYRMEGLLTTIVEEDLAAFQAAEALETALVNQKGFVSYYFLDGDPDWLRQLGEYRQIFKEQLRDVRARVKTQEQNLALKAIASEYKNYTTLKDQVIQHYKKGEREAGSRLHEKARKHFFKVLALCEQYKNIHGKRIEALRKNSTEEAAKLRIVVGIAMFCVIVLAVLLILVLFKQIFEPVRRLARAVPREKDPEDSGNELAALSRRVHGLLEDIDHTHSELERSQENLLQTEKMAMVGKLAAGTAHSIRNPLTSVKMRLFSLGRTLNLSSTQKEDFDVISEEIGHIETIVQNFLEFSRPPKLIMQQVSPSDVVDLTLQLLKHRLQSYDVTVELDRGYRLPEISADPEQLKEVLVNIIENACEAMVDGGSILIREEGDRIPLLGEVAVIRIEDSGPGIPNSVVHKIFDPFYTTKEEGSGLGLSIAFRIVKEHGGRVEVSSVEGVGTTFTITIPVSPA